MAEFPGELVPPEDIVQRRWQDLTILGNKMEKLPLV